MKPGPEHALLALGVVIAIVGLATASAGTLIVGVLVAIVGVLAPGLKDLDLRLPGARLTLNREPVELAAHHQALERGLSPAEAGERAQRIAEEAIPPEGARIVLERTGGASARLRGGGQVTADVPDGSSPEDALAREIARQGLFICDRCGFHAPGNTADLRDGAYCPACGHGRLELLR